MSTVTQTDLYADVAHDEFEIELDSSVTPHVPRLYSEDGYNIRQLPDDGGKNGGLWQAQRTFEFSLNGPKITSYGFGEDAESAKRNSRDVAALNYCRTILGGFQNCRRNRIGLSLFTKGLTDEVGHGRMPTDVRNLVESLLKIDLSA